MREMTIGSWTFQFMEDISIPEDQIKFVHPDGRTDYIIGLGEARDGFEQAHKDAANKSYETRMKQPPYSSGYGG